MRMRHRATHKSHISHFWKADVTDILAAAMKEPIIFLAAKPRADPAFGQCQSPERIADGGALITLVPIGNQTPTGCVCRKSRPFDLVKESRNVGHDGRAALLPFKA